MEVLMRLSQDELERHRLAERMRAQRDAASFAADLRDGRKFAYEQGFAEGFAEGFAKGLRIGRVRVLQRYLGFPEMSLAELDRLPDEHFEQLEETLNRQLNVRKQGTDRPPTHQT
jgi:flagellar biosynthesis/type III secretory pathway protein FliH